MAHSFFHFSIIGLGGAMGAIMRVWIIQFLPETLLGIPFQIFFINVVGCFLMGVLVEVFALHGFLSEHLRYFLASGFLGGFTTFSAFSLDFGLLIERNQWALALLYAASSVILSLIFFFLGIKLIRFLSISPV